jgi:metal-responsive CopG/Arc/MetJ family transcriptional regulator
MPRRRNEVPATKFLVSLDQPLAIDLEAFCRAHYGAPRVEVIRHALRDFFKEQLLRDEDFAKAKAQLTSRALPFQIVKKKE